MGLGKTIQMLSLITSRPMNKPTLIIVPVSIMLQWIQEITTKVVQKLDVILFHGKTKSTTTLEQLQSSNIVVTSYGAVMRFNLLNLVDWGRVVLDEAHIIKNHKSTIANSVMDLQSDTRWCLTGTPIHNRKMEMYSFARFLRIRHYRDRKVFQRMIRSERRFKLFIQMCLLRRSKDFKLNNESVIKLVDKASTISKTVFSTDEQNIYDTIFKNAQMEINQFIQQGTVLKNYNHIFTMLLRLRQICLHPDLVIQKMDDLERVIGLPSMSSKLSKVTETVTTWRNDVPNDKILIFCQFTEFIEMIHDTLASKGIRSLMYTHYFFNSIRYTGSQSPQERDDIISDFKNNQDIKVLIISIKCGSLGLNLTTANRIILVDVWWHPFIEYQAIDRCHRFGQEKQVFVERLIVKDSIEERIPPLFFNFLGILILQDEKKQMFDQFINGQHSKGTRLSVADIEFLFQLEQQ
jgi:SNF2 family DNA or RNA helicase